MKKIVVLSGAGISAESGLATFRDPGGIWEKVDISQVATPEAWREAPERVLDFYNSRRRQLLSVEPNAAHRALVELERAFEVWIVTQNVDDLHERAGSTRVAHLHGELLKARGTLDESLVLEWREDIRLGDLCPLGSQLRPHIVWFGEEVPMMERAMEIIQNADIVIVVGTSLQVYPAAGLLAFAPENAALYYIDPNPAEFFAWHSSQRRHIIAERASAGVRRLVDELLG
jgi:NAD-dependent deacetylase